MTGRHFKAWIPGQARDDGFGHSQANFMAMTVLEFSAQDWNVGA